MTETNGQQPLRNISHSWCFYNRSPSIKLDALDGSKYMYKALGTFLSSPCSKIKKNPDRKDIEHDIEVGNFKIAETFHRQLRPSTQIQRAAKVQKRKFSDITQSGNSSAENLYLNEKIRKKLKASNSLSDISWCSLDDVNSECFQKSQSSNVLKRQPLDSKLCHLPMEDYRRKLRSSHSTVEANKNCESMRKHSLSSSYSGNSNGSGSCADRSYASDLEVVCEFQCRPIFVILEKLSKHKIKQLTSVGNLRTESVKVTRAMDSNKVAEPVVDAAYTKNVTTDNEASYLASHKSFDKFLNSSCVQNVEVTELSAGNLSDQSEHTRHDLEKGATDVIDVSSSSKFDRCFGMGRLDSKKDSVRLIDIENESKELVCAKDHIVGKLKHRHVQDSDGTATPVSSTVRMQLESKSIKKKRSRDIVDSFYTDANIELPLKHNSTPLGSHDVDSCSALSAGDDDTSPSSESTIDLSDEWTSAEYHKIVSDDIDSLQISDPHSCNQDVSKLSDNTRLLKAVSMSDHENLGLCNCISNGNVGNLLTTLDSLPEQRDCYTPVKSNKRGSKINSRLVCRRKRSGLHRNGSKWGNGNRDYSNNSDENRNNGNNLSSTGKNRNGSGNSQNNCCIQRRKSCEKYDFDDAKRSLKETKDHSVGKNNLCAKRNISCTDSKLSYLDVIDTPSECVKEKGKESVLCEPDSDSDESLFKNCSKFSGSSLSDTATAEERMDEDHFKVLDAVEDDCDFSDSYVPNFMTHSPHLHCQDDSVIEWRRVADLEEWWLNDRVNFEPSLESQISVLQDEECQYANEENERRPLAADAFQWCAMLADQSEWPDIDLCCFHDEANVDGCHFNTVKGLCVNKNKVVTSTQDVVFYSTENGKFEMERRLSETADSFVANSRPFNHSTCRTSEEQQISLDPVNELTLKTTRSKSGFLDSEPDARVKLDSGVFNAPGATDILCLTNAKSEAIKSDSCDKFTDSSAASSRDFNSNFDHNVSNMYDYNPSFASNGDESRLSMPFSALQASRSYFPSFQMLPDARICSAVPISNVATVNSLNDINPLRASTFTTSVQNAYKPVTEPCCRAVLLSVCSPLLGSADQTFLGPPGSRTSKGVSRNHTSAAASFSHVCPSPVYDHVISQMQATTCSHYSSQSSFVNTCYASLCQHNSSLCSNSSSCSLLNEDLSVACSLTVSSNVSWPKESSCSNLGFGLQPVLDFPCSRKFLDNANSLSAYDQKPNYPAFTASCSEIASNCLSVSTTQPSEVKFPSSVSSADDRNLDVINASSSFNSPGMIRDSWSSLVCSETTPNAKVCKRTLQQNELETSKRCSNDLPASEKNLSLSERSDDTIGTQSTLAEYNLKSSQKTCTLNKDPVISNDNGSVSYDDCNSDMCSWLAASMGLYTCICGAAFSDSWSCLQHQFKCSVMIKQ